MATLLFVEEYVSEVQSKILVRHLDCFVQNERLNNLNEERLERPNVAHSARIHASLFNSASLSRSPLCGSAKHVFEQNRFPFALHASSASLSFPFSKNEATIRNIGDMIGWEGDITVYPN
jgi:hypothetical protein